MNHCNINQIEFKVERLLDDNFEHELVFEYLKNINFYDKI